MDKDTIFDIASVTKVVSATTAAMLLYSKGTKLYITLGLLDLD
jgi:CubicO group peptidase (beta-lactamase class C family)